MRILSALRRRLLAELDPRLAPRFHDTFAATPITIYDVGAAGGVFTPYAEGPQAWAPVIGFEPHPESYQAILAAGLAPHVSLHNTALADRDGPVTFHSGEGHDRTRSSLLPIAYIGGKSEAVTVDGMTLDAVPEKLGVAPADFIKLDTEGTEDVILKSGPEMLKHDILGIQVEIAFWVAQSGGVAFSEIDRLLSSFGFVLFDLQLNRSDVRVIGGRKDKVRSGDALYLRNFDSLSSDSGDQGKLRIQLLKLISLAIGWRYLNYALELADFGRTAGLLDADEFADIAAPLVRTSDLSDRTPNLPGRMALAQLFETLSYALHPNMKKGVPYAFNGLGNHWVVKRGSNIPESVGLHCPVLKSGTTNLSKTIKIKARHES